MTTLERLLYVNKTGHELMKHHGLLDRGWRFKLGNSKRRLGMCSHDEKTIEFSKWYLDNPDEDIVDTILHEIAHALVGRGHGHDDVWVDKCYEIGAKPERLADPTVKSKAQPNFLIRCENPDCPVKPSVKKYRIKREYWANATCRYCGGKFSFYSYRK
jgi:predicted SprT family Zn-dependent metalloprotease